MMNQNMIRKLQKIQREMEEAQKEIEETVFTGSAGGIITIEMTGNKFVQNVEIDPECLDKDDVEMLQDTMVAAINDVMNKIDKETEAVMSKYSAMLPNMPF